MFGIPPVFWVVINSVTSFVYLFIISKVLGKKQIAQLEFIDYAVGISLGSIIAEWAFDTERPFYFYIIASSIFFVLALFVAIIGRKNTFFKRMIKGKPATLVYEGKIIYKQLNKCKIDVNDLLSMLREKGFFDIDDVAYALFETSGKLSVLPKGNKVPVVVQDLPNAKISKSSLTNVLVVDGEISKSGLNELNKTKEWLFEKLNLESKKDLKNILLASYSEQTNQFSVHHKEDVIDH